MMSFCTLDKNSFNSNVGSALVISVRTWLMSFDLKTPPFERDRKKIKKKDMANLKEEKKMLPKTEENLSVKTRVTRIIGLSLSSYWDLNSNNS